MIRIVAISDTHNRHRELAIPDGDILIHAGDFSRKGQIEDLIEFNNWLSELPHKYKILVAGNHDFCFQVNPEESYKILTNAIYLQDEFIILEGLKIYGSPWQPWFFDWAFNLKRGHELAAKWAMIPEDTHVVVTHGPPHGILDLTNTGKKVGCEELIKKIKIVQPQLHIFGHIHESYGMLEQDGVQFVNASSCDVSYRAVNKPIMIEI